jgi:hypothetical protein
MYATHGSAANGQSGGTGSTWAALVKRVFEVNPLECAKCGAEMKVIAFIERGQRDVVEKILRHCGLWEGPLRTLPRPGGHPTQRLRIETHLSRASYSWSSIRSSFSEHLSRPQTCRGSCARSVRTDQVVRTPRLPQKGAILVCQGSAEPSRSCFRAVRRNSEARSPHDSGKIGGKQEDSCYQAACRAGSLARRGLKSLSVT